jgi:Na+-driven multidrug efflux pump
VGAAGATTFSQALSVVISLTYLYRRREAFGFDFRPRSFVPEWRYLKMLLRLGVPMAAQYAAILLSQIFIASRVNIYGVAASAANGVTTKLDNIVRIVPNSVSTAASAMIGQNIAAGKHHRVEKILLYALIGCGIWGLVCGLVTYSFPERIFSLFDTSEAVQAYGRVYAPAGLLSYIANGLRGASNALLNGIGFAMLSFVSSIIDGVLARIGFSMLLANTAGRGIFGFWLGSALAGFIPVLIGGTYFLTGRWKTYELLKDPKKEEA